MTNAKVSLPREVAEAIEGLRRFDVHRDDSKFIEAHVKIRSNPDEWSWSEYPELNEVPTDVFARAILNGYKIEKSPEDDVRGYYNGAVAHSIEAMYSEGRSRADGEIVGIKRTLNLLGIKIEGVNT